MSQNLSILEQLQRVVIDCLVADPMFDGTLASNGQVIPLIVETKGDITEQIHLALGTVGVCALIMTPAFEFIDEMLYPPDLAGWALVAVTIYENPTLNLGPTGTKLPSIRLAQEVLAALHGFPLNLPSPASPARVPAFIGTKRPIVMTNEGPPLQYTISFLAYVFLP